MNVIRIQHNGRDLLLSEYVALIKTVKASLPATMFKESLRGWWPAAREEILRQHWRMVEDRINRFTKIAPDLTASRLLALKRAHIVSECKWCGSSLGEYRQPHARFCDVSCRLSYS